MCVCVCVCVYDKSIRVLFLHRRPCSTRWKCRDQNIIPYIYYIILIISYLSEIVHKMKDLKRKNNYNVCTDPI